jgi:integrase
VTIYLDRRFRQVGRIKKAAGTDHKPTVKRLDEMLTGLFERGRLDILRGIQKGEYTPLQVWQFYRTGEIEKLPTAASMSPLEASMKDWIDDKECAESHRRSLHQSLRHLMSVGNKSATIADLPELLLSLRPKMKAAKHPQTFRLAKAAAQAFVKSRLTKAHPLYFQVMAVEGLKIVQQRAKTPLSPVEYMQLVKKLNAPHNFTASAMAMTGMGPGEYWGKWYVEGIDRIHIFGTKREGRNRVVPYLREIFIARAPDGDYKAFRIALKEAGRITPYDLRRTYANWLEAAGIPRTRRRLYLGHGATDVTDLYERHDVDRFITADGVLLTEYLINAMAVRPPQLVLEA